MIMPTADSAESTKDHDAKIDAFTRTSTGNKYITSTSPPRAMSSIIRPTVSNALMPGEKELVQAMRQSSFG